MNGVCSCCKANRNVFLEAKPSPDNSGYKLVPICLSCKTKQIEADTLDAQIDNLVNWETDLKKIERQISKQIILNTFPHIKFKRVAMEKILKLMRKYPIRKIFEACTLDSNSNFSISEIEKNCNEKA